MIALKGQKTPSTFIYTAWAKDILILFSICINSHNNKPSMIVLKAVACDVWRKSQGGGNWECLARSEDKKMK